MIVIPNDSPLDKGKERVDGVAAEEPLERLVVPTAPELGDTSPSSTWPDFTKLALIRAGEEVPSWGQPTLEFKDASNPEAEPLFVLDDKDEVAY